MGFVNRQVFLPMISRAARKLKVRADVVWTYLPTDSAIELMRLLSSPTTVTIYYCAADFLELTTSRRELELTEKEVVENSDLVFAVCSELAQRCEQSRDEAHVFPPGVDLKAFSPRAGGHEELGKTFKHPVIGYVGGLHRCVDYHLLSTMARLRPDWSWVLVGPEQVGTDELAGLENVQLLGQQGHDSLAAYISLFDVCIVPYVKSAYTNTVVPVKINEYLAMGKPVVSTNIRAVNDFNIQHNVLLTVEPRADDFLSAIEQALQSTSNEVAADHRRSVASLSDWSTRVEAMSDLIAAKLVEKNSAVALCNA